MAIRTHHADRIYRGDKQFEYRRQRPRFTPGIKVYVYEPRPVQAITGYFHVAELIDLDKNLADLEHNKNERDSVETYLHGARRPTAIAIAAPTRLAQPLALAQLGLKAAPQSYVYTESE